MALYGFARLADQLGDEAPGDRLAALAALEAELQRAFEGRARHPLLRALEPTLRARALPREPFLRLLEANRLDQRVCRYASFDALLGYCALSAQPLGRLVLHVFDAHTPENGACADAICNALQVAEHLQDVAEDFARGRIYLPAEDLARFGCRESDLGRRGPATPALRRVAACQAARARQLLCTGEPLLARLAGGARLAVAAFAGGGHAALDALERAGWDVHSPRLRPRRRDLVRRSAALLWRAAAPGGRR